MNNYDYPVGADSSSAPWNEEIIPHKRFVSMSISFEYTVEGPRDMPEEYIEELIKENLYHTSIPEGFNIDEITVVNDE